MTVGQIFQLLWGDWHKRLVQGKNQLQKINLGGESATENLGDEL